MANPNPAINGVLQRLAQRLNEVEKTNARLLEKNDQLTKQVDMLVADSKVHGDNDVSHLKGRRILYSLSGQQKFTASVRGQRGEPISFSVNQDGLFVMTAYPLVMWRPSAPENAARFGFWRPVSHWPLPAQATNEDIIDISYELQDAGSQRLFQNSPANPLLSQPNNPVPLPEWTVFPQNTTINFFATYNGISFADADDVAGPRATTEGILSVTLPGFRIIGADR